MKGVISFHPLDPDFFDSTIEPLVMGEKIDPGAFVSAALRHLVSSWEAAHYKQTLDFLLEQLEPPPPPEHGTLWDKVRTRLERFDHKPSALVRHVGAKIEPDLHLDGRPYLITEGSAESVASVIEEFMQVEHETSAQSLILEQLVRLDPAIAKGIELGEFDEAPSPGSYRADLLNSLKAVYEMARAARDGQSWESAAGRREQARTVLIRELPWLAMHLHSRAVPFWIACDVDGLENLCRASGVEPPDFIVPAWPLFPRSCEEYPEIRERLGVEVRDQQSVGAYVAPRDIPDLLAFLNENGSRMIQAAARHDVGSTCKTLLRKIRECVCFAHRAGVGYVEAGGILPIGPQHEDPSGGPRHESPEAGFAARRTRRTVSAPAGQTDR